MDDLLYVSLQPLDPGVEVGDSGNKLGHYGKGEEGCGQRPFVMSGNFDVSIYTRHWTAGDVG